MSAAAGKHEFRLLSGRTIRLDRLDQYWTYGGLLAGHPSHEMNRRMMDRLVTTHSGTKWPGVPVLLEPIETPLAKFPLDPDWSTAAALPSITCIARFMSDVLPDDAESFGSVLRVIWFQDGFAFPIDSVVKVELAALDWEARATGWLP